MLSEQNRPIVEATLPVVGEHIGEIARRFYRHLFGEHPELIDGTFNRGNQARGEQQQALAGSVAAFASTLVKTPEQVPEKLLSRIAHKHASLGIRPDQYQVVHDNLMWAIVDVLGDAVTPQVAAAWDEVYWPGAARSAAASTPPSRASASAYDAQARWPMPPSTASSQSAASGQPPISGSSRRSPSSWPGSVPDPGARK